VQQYSIKLFNATACDLETAAMEWQLGIQYREVNVWSKIRRVKIPFYPVSGFLPILCFNLQIMSLAL